MSSDEAVEPAYAFLRGHTTGDLRFEDHLRPLRYVIDSEGRLVAPVMYTMLNALDTVLFVPDFAEGAMEIQVTLSAFDHQGAGEAVADRWRIYHGEPKEAHWAQFVIDAARYRECVVDGEALQRPNRLAGDEARLCRELNQQHHDDLRRVCRRFASADVETPIVVGVDPDGFDVRRRFDVVRVAAPEPMPTAGDVARVFQQMLKACA